MDDGTVEDVAWALLDHQNSVRQLAVYDGQYTEVVKTVAYDTFGNVVSDSAPGIETLFLYTARPFDPESGLQNNLHRWYDAQIGRWLTADPITFAAGDANLYRYCGNGPLTHIDATGLEKAWVSFAEPAPAYVAGSGAMARSPFGPEPPQWMLEQAIDDSNSASSPGYWHYLLPGNSAPADPWILNWGSGIAGGIGIGALLIAGGVVILAPGAAGAGAGAGTTVEIAAVTYPSALVTTEIVAAPLAPALVTTKIVAAAPMTLSSTIAVGSTITAAVTATDVAVIGYLDYTLAFDGVAGFNVLNVPSHVWSWAGSDVPWLENITALGQSLIVYPGGKFTEQEIAWLIEAGYVHLENLMVPGVLP